jgi:hypothetical protein
MSSKQVGPHNLLNPGRAHNTIRLHWKLTKHGRHSNLFNPEWPTTSALPGNDNHNVALSSHSTYAYPQATTTTWQELDRSHVILSSRPPSIYQSTQVFHLGLLIFNSQYSQSKIIKTAVAFCYLLGILRILAMVQGWLHTTRIDKHSIIFENKILPCILVWKH